MNEKNLTISIFHEAFVVNGPAYDYHRYSRIQDARGTNPRIRTEVHIDTSYAYQSRGHTQVFTPDGWKDVSTLPGQEIASGAESAYGRSDEPKRASANRVADRLERIALEVLAL